MKKIDYLKKKIKFFFYKFKYINLERFIFFQKLLKYYNSFYYFIC